MSDTAAPTPPPYGLSPIAPRAPAPPPASLRFLLALITVLAIALIVTAVAFIYERRSGGASSGSGAAARVNGALITTTDVDSAIAQPLSKLQEQIYSTRMNRLNTLIDERLIDDEAKRRGTTSAALIAAEVTRKAPDATDEDIAAFFQANRERLPGELPRWQDQIRTYLNNQRVDGARGELVKRLRESARVEVYLPPPPVFRATVDTAGAQVRGPATAPVTIIEFSDFHCPYCRQVQPVLQQLLAAYGDRLRIVYKDMPIDSLHPQARTVAEAARCAADQGKFWEFHDHVYANAPDGSPETLERFAREAGVEVAQFEACRASRTHQAQVQKDVQQGADLGLTGTPGFFVNGRFLYGSQPLEAFRRIIDQELSAQH
jgi:protein-disulfide isomerase